VIEIVPAFEPLAAELLKLGRLGLGSEIFVADFVGMSGPTPSDPNFVAWVRSSVALAVSTCARCADVRDQPGRSLDSSPRVQRLVLSKATAANKRVRVRTRHQAKSV